MQGLIDLSGQYFFDRPTDALNLGRRLIAIWAAGRFGQRISNIFYIFLKKKEPF